MCFELVCNFLLNVQTYIHDKMRPTLFNFKKLIYFSFFFLSCFDFFFILKCTFFESFKTHQSNKILTLQYSTVKP